MNPSELWAFLPWGYLATVAVELPVLLIGLSPRHPVRDRVTAGLWLTACTYPIVVLVLPLLIEDYTAYLLVAETFAPLCECLLFYAMYTSRRTAAVDIDAVAERSATRRATSRDMAAIVVANLASFGLGMLWNSYVAD